MAAIAASSKKNYQYVDYGDADGAVLGQAASCPIGFYGYTPVSQAVSASTLLAAVSDFTACTNSTDAGTVNIAAVATALNTLLSDLMDLGIIASS